MSVIGERSGLLNRLMRVRVPSPPFWQRSSAVEQSVEARRVGGSIPSVATHLVPFNGFQHEVMETYTLTLIRCRKVSLVHVGSIPTVSTMVHSQCVQK